MRRDMATKPNDYEDYERVTAQILKNLRDELGIETVNQKTVVPGQSGTSWKCDVTCYKTGTQKLVIVECRKYRSKIKQEDMGGFAYRVEDAGATEGLMVTPIGYQQGAQLVANSAKIGMATLNPEATEYEYALQIAKKLFIGIMDQVRFSDSCTVERRCGKCKQVLTEDGPCPTCKPRSE
jgi:hypothetical protein